jgi:hypothetical protein
VLPCPLLHPFLRATTRNKGGKECCYFSVVETRRVTAGLCRNGTLRRSEAIRLSFHQEEKRIEAQTIIAFHAHCLHVALAVSSSATSTPQASISVMQGRS